MVRQALPRTVIQCVSKKNLPVQGRSVPSQAFNTRLARQGRIEARPYKYRHSGRSSESVPIIAANMDTVGTFEMAAALAKHRDARRAAQAALPGGRLRHFLQRQQPSGASLLRSIRSASPIPIRKVPRRENDTGNNIELVCIDVANGYTETFLDFVKRFREAYPGITIMAGNVVTATSPRR